MRIAVAVAIGAVLGLRSWFELRRSGAWIQANDFTYAWFGARELLAGRDPYVTVKAAHLPWGPYLFYPVPTFLLAIPFAAFPPQLAGALFVCVSAALLSFALWPLERWRLLVFVSAPMLVAAGAVQWSPLLLAGTFVLPLAGVLTAKPNLALPLVAFRPKLVAPAIVGGLALLVVSFAFLPRWIPEWLAMARTAGPRYGYLTPIAQPMGWVLALAALRWREPEARLLLVMACVPQKLLFYDQLPLLLIPKSLRTMQVVVLISLVALAVSYRETWTSPEATARLAALVIPSMYWPALALVLMRRTPAYAAA